MTALTVRFGLGKDLHRLRPGGPLRLGGIDVPSEVEAVGHSDGDALLHAVTDAILGAVAQGDIGQHFSDRDPAHAGRDSATMLHHAVEVARRVGWRPVQVDAVLSLQRPKLAPHHPVMRERVATLLSLPLDVVSIKAKTGEGVDAVGEGRAVACDVIVQLAPV